MANKPAERFAGESAVETTYRLTFEEVMAGFAAAETIRRDIRKILYTIMLLLCAVMLITTFGTPMQPLGFGIELVIIYLLYRRWILPLQGRRRIAKSIAEKNAEYRISIFETGVRVLEGDETHDLRKKNLSCYAAQQCMLLVSQGRMIIVPNRYWGEQLGAAQQRLQEMLGSRYLLLGRKKTFGGSRPQR